MTADTARPKRLWKLFIILGIILVLGAGIFVWKRHQDSDIAYKEVSVTKEDIEVTIFSTGVVQPENRLEIKPPVSGRIEEVLTDEGHYVKKGQIIAWMSSTERAALLDAARALGPKELKKWKDFYKATPILAPLDGTIILRNVEPGQTVSNNDSCFSLSDRLIVNAQVDETDIAQIRLKQPAQVILDAYPGQTISAHVEKIAYDAKTVSNVTTYEVNVLPDHVPHFMKSGMTVNVYFVTASKKNVLILPSEAVKIQEDQSYVLVGGPDRRSAPMQKSVVTGITDGKHVEIVSGLALGDKVLIPQYQASGQKSGGINPFMPVPPSRKTRSPGPSPPP